MSDNRSRVKITHEDGWWKVYIVAGRTYRMTTNRCSSVGTQREKTL